MNRWQRIAAAFPLVMALIEQADSLKGLTKGSDAWDQAIAGLVDTIVNVVEIVIGRDLIDNTRLRTAILASLNIRPAPAA